MRHPFTILLAGVLLAGCASTRLPTCDGRHRRPINPPAQAGLTPPIHYPSCGAAAPGEPHEARATA